MRRGWFRQVCRVQKALVWSRLLLVMGCVAPSGNGPSVVESSRPWSESNRPGRQITTEHYNIYSTLEDRPFEEALPRFLETCYANYEAMLPGARPAGVRSTTYIFGTRDEWLDFTRRHYPGRYPIYSRIRSGGFTEDATAVTFYVKRAESWAMLAHEGWHQYVGARLDAAVPPWLAEGLGCYHEAVSFARDGPVFHPLHNSFRMNAIRNTIRLRKLILLRDLLGADVGEIVRNDNQQSTQIYYAQVWALVTFLRHGADGRFRDDFDRMLKDIASGTFAIHVRAWKLANPGGTETSFSEAVIPAYFGVSVDDISADYGTHLLTLAGFRRP